MITPPGTSTFYVMMRNFDGTRYFLTDVSRTVDKLSHISYRREWVNNPLGASGSTSIDELHRFIDQHKINDIVTIVDVSECW